MRNSGITNKTMIAATPNGKRKRSGARGEGVEGKGDRGHGVNYFLKVGLTGQIKRTVVSTQDSF